MRRLLLRNVPPEIQKVIRKKAREDHIANDEAVIELTRDLEVELAVQHDIALMEKQWEDEQDEEFGRDCSVGHCHCSREDDPVATDDLG